MKVRFLLVAEGSSDAALVQPLEDLCLLLGADEVTGVAPDLSRLTTKSLRVVDKLRTAAELDPAANLIFIHRDADAPDPSPRYEEINAAAEAVALVRPHVGVVPVQTSEAWALLDEEAIRRAADNPSGRVPLAIPRPSQVENVADPKGRLDKLLVKASEESGRRLARFKRRLSAKRYVLLEQLDLDGPVRYVPAWRRLRDDLKEALSRV